MNKKRIVSILLLIALVFTAASVGTGAEKPLPSAKIVANNLSFNDTIYLVYYVDFQDVPVSAETGVLIWKSAPAAFTYDTAEEKITETIGTDIYSGAAYPLYAYRGLNAKNMTDDIYAMPYVKDGNTVTYGNKVKYSVLRYAYNKLGYTGTATDNDDLKALLHTMLDYGAAAQTYFKYKVDALANSEFYLVKAVNGRLSDGTLSGLY